MGGIFDWIFGGNDDEVKKTYDQGYQRSTDELRSGYNKSQAQYDNALNEYNNLNPYIERGRQAGNTLASYYGINGTGNSGASNILRNMPAYKYTVDEMKRNTQSQAAASGIARSGRAYKAMARGMESEAMKNADSWLNGIRGIADSGFNADLNRTTGRANVYGQKAGADLNYGDALSNLTKDYTNKKAEIVENQTEFSDLLPLLVTLASIPTGGSGGAGMTVAGMLLSKLLGSGNTDASNSGNTPGRTNAPLQY